MKRKRSRGDSGRGLPAEGPKVKCWLSVDYGPTQPQWHHEQGFTMAAFEDNLQLRTLKPILPAPCQLAKHILDDLVENQKPRPDPNNGL